MSVKLAVKNSENQELKLFLHVETDSDLGDNLQKKTITWFCLYVCAADNQ